MKFLYVANCGLPETAAGLRIYYIATILRKLGHSVDFLCGIYNEQEIMLYDGFTYLFDTNKTFFSRLLNTLFGVTTRRRLKKRLSQECYDAVIAYNDVNGVSKLVWKLGVNFYSDVTEWYSFSVNNAISDNLAALKTNHRILKFDKHSSGVIAISQFLFDYYCKKNIKVVYIPPIVIMPDHIVFEKHNGINLIYSGSPRNKDFLSKVVKALDILNKDHDRFNMLLVGISEVEYLKKFKQRTLPSFINTIGRIPHHKVSNYYAMSDYSVLMRKKKRYAKAGYSTKFAESLSYGVPVICNRVGGADLDIVDGYNGFTLNATYSVRDICSLLEMISTLDTQRIVEMRNNSFTFAKQKYNKTQYYDAISKLVEVKS